MGSRRATLALGTLLGLLTGCAAASPVAPAPPTSTPNPTPSSTPRAPTHTPLTRLPLLYATDASGQGQIVLRDESGDHPLTTPTDPPAWQPALSADGSRILFTGRRDGQSDIARFTATGQPPEWLTEHPADDYDPAWHPDGARVAWTSERDGQPWVWTRSLADPSTAAPLPAPGDGWRARDPAWGADGTLYLTALDETRWSSIYRVDPVSGALERLVAPPLGAAQPAPRADGVVAFVGWEAPPLRGLYLLEPGAAPRALWETTDWIGDPAWSADGEWLLFTRWSDVARSHDLWAIPSVGGEPRPVTAGGAWEADAQPLPGGTGLPPEPIATAAPLPTDPTPLALGFNVASFDNAYLMRTLGFTWAKGFADWERIEPAPGTYRWIDVDNTVNAAERQGINLLLRVDRTPTWARPPDTTGSHPPEDLDAYARFLETLARRYRGRVAGYELWNEPNLSFEWGEQPPDPERYVEMLRVAREALQRGDPDAILVVAALAVAGNGPRSMDELEWLDRFYTALGGERPYDALSTHPYGFGGPPGRPPDEGPGLRRVEQHRALMLAHGDDSPLWLSEIGYVRRTPGWSLGEHEPWVVDDATQARYLVETLDYIAANYPFVEAIFLFNLDFSTVDWYTAGEQMRAYAILDSARRPLPAFSALRRHWLAGEVP